MALFRILAALAAAMMISVAGAAAAQNSDIYDEYDPLNPPSASASPNEGRATTITVSAPYALSSIAVHAQAATAGDWVFFVYNRTNSTLVFATPPKAMSAGTMLRSSDLFAPAILQPGQNYIVGAVANVAATYGTVDVGPNTIGVVTNANPTRRTAGFPIPADSAFGSGARMQIVLNGVAQPVPTLSEWAMILLGAVLASGAALMIRRRQFVAVLGAALVLAAFSSSANAQAWRYDVTSDPNNGGVTPAATTSPCIGDCSPLTDAPPAGYLEIERPYVPGADTPLSGYNLTMGGLRFTPQNSTFRGYVRADVTGRITNSAVVLTRGPISTAIGPVDPAARVSVFYYLGSNVSLTSNAYCTGRSGTACTAYSRDQYSSESRFSASRSMPYDPPVVAAVPTISEWGLIILGLMFAGGSALYLQQRRQVG